MRNTEVSVKLVRDDGKTFLIDGTNWVIPSDGLDGFGSIANEISSIDNALGDGVVITSQRLSKKDRTVKCYVSNANYNEELRHHAIAFFNAKRYYKLYITYMGYTRWCEGYLYKMQISEGNIFNRVQLQFTLLSASPYLKSFDDFGKDIAGVTPMVAFPYLCNIITGAPTGIYNFGRDVHLNNDGDAPTYCRAILRSTGDVVNPKLEINGKYVRIIDTMEVGDEIVIDFTSQPPTVKKNGVNIIGKADRTSSFNGMEIQLDENIIGYTADEGDTFLQVSIYFNKLYLVI